MSERGGNLNEILLLNKKLEKFTEAATAAASA